MPAIHGLDQDRGLAAVHGSAEKYRRLLALFAQAHGGDGEKGAKLLATGDREGLFQLAHRLKGAAGSVGAVQVQQSADALVAALRSQAGTLELEALTQALTRDLSALIGDLGAILNGVGDHANDVDRQRLADVLSRLTELLRAGDITANTLARDEEALLRISLGDTGRRLLQSIAAFDHEGALATIGELERR